jgi:hypothetical protein
MQRRIRNDDVLARQQFPNLGQPQPVFQPPLDGRALRHASVPAVAAGPPARRMERQQHVAQPLVRDRPRLRPHAHRLGRPEIPPHGLRVEADLRGEPLLGHALVS